MRVAKLTGLHQGGLLASGLRQELCLSRRHPRLPLCPKLTGFAILLGGVSSLQQNCGHGQPNLITTAGAVGYLAPVPCNKVSRGGRMARGGALRVSGARESRECPMFADAQCYVERH